MCNLAMTLATGDATEAEAPPTPAEEAPEEPAAKAKKKKKKTADEESNLEFRLERR